jgi:tetratricopeptide (TPR) repeat protein
VDFRRFRLIGCGLLAGVVIASGCGELITYSFKSRRAGIEAYEQQRYEDAAGAFRNATQQNPRDYISFYYLGKIFQSTGRQQQALQSFKTAVEVMPVTLEGKQDETFRMTVIDALAECVNQAPSREQEVAALEDSANTSQRANDWFVVARTHAMTGDADSAIDAYSRAVLAGPKDKQITRSYALYLEKIGQTRRAEPVLRRAYQLNPQDAEVADALRRVGVVPGPSLLEEQKLVQPIVPKGPIPELELRVKENPASTAGSNP